ncbi:MAG: methyltransferase [Ignavibacteriae bacterium]|nr:methyltransferase [Ignavibacteriota bacterium]
MNSRIGNGNIKLNLGCGRAILPGFVNADISAGEGVDLIVDLNDIGALRTQTWYGNVQFVYLSHVLEHFPTTLIPTMLRELHTLLADGGRIRIAVPDLDKICRLYVKNIEWFNPPHNPWLGLIYGGQIDRYDFHKTGYNFAYLRWLLETAGFGNVVEIGSSDDLGIMDGSHSNLPFGNISLNVEATKGIKRERTVFQYTAVEKIVGWCADVLLKVFQTLIRIRIALIRRRIRKSLTEG